MGKQLCSDEVVKERLTPDGQVYAIARPCKSPRYTRRGPRGNLPNDGTRCWDHYQKLSRNRDGWDTPWNVGGRIRG